jgi:peptidoglycan/LPS O-acetylase OafA/YrhL
LNGDRHSSVPEAAPAPERLEGLDTLKGIAIAAVVSIHAAPVEAHEYLVHGINGPARLAVPLFFAISGFLLGRRWPSRQKLASYFWKFLRLHLLYGAFYFALEPLRFGVYRTLTVKWVVMHFAAYSYPGQFFLFVLPQIYFLFAFVVPERARSGAPLFAASLALAAATVAWVASAFAAGFEGPLQGRLAGSAEALATLWLFPFVLGIVLGKRVGVRAPSGTALAASLAVAALAAVLAAFDFPETVDPSYVLIFAYARWSILIASTLPVLTLPWIAGSEGVAPLSALGRESFGIFVLNPLVIGMFVLAAGPPHTVAQSLALSAAAIAIAFALTRWLRPRLPFAFP